MNTDCKTSKESLKNFQSSLQSAEKRIEHGLGKLALGDIELCFTLEPNLKVLAPKLYLLKGKAYLKLGESDNAIAACDKALELDSGLNEAHKLKGEAYINKEDFDEAVRQYEKAVNGGDNSAQEGLQNARKRQKMAQRKDYYKVLDIPKTASDKEIKKAYRKLAMIYHPDKAASGTPEQKEEASEKMKEIGEAYDILSNPDKKGKYDRGEDIDMNQGGGGFNPFQGFQWNFRRG